MSRPEKTLHIWMILFFLQGFSQKKLSTAGFKAVQILAILAALAGLYFTYNNFRHTTSHRWLGERFHVGGYLFWIGWITISVFYLSEKKSSMILVDYSTGTDTLTKSGDKEID